MVGLASILSPIPKTPSRDIPAATDETRKRLETLVAGIIELISPLASVSARGELKKLSDRIAPEYLHLKNEAGRLIINQLSPQEFSQFATNAYKDALDLIRANVTVLGVEEQKALADVVESLSELLQGILDSAAENQGTLVDILLECSPALQRVDMFLLTILFILTPEISRWNPGAIKLLTKATVANIRQVEDIFLIYDSELASRLRTREQTVSLEEVKREVGLCS